MFDLTPASIVSSKLTVGLPSVTSRLSRPDPDGHPKLLHLWPVKLLQAGRTDGDYTGVAVMREAASFNR